MSTPPRLLPPHGVLWGRLEARGSVPIEPFMRVFIIIFGRG